MNPTDVADRAARIAARAEADEAAAFDRQYELERRTQRWVVALAEQGRQRGQQWAADDRRDEADRRFDPEPEESPAAVAAAGPSAPRRPARVTDEEEDDDAPGGWLR